MFECARARYLFLCRQAFEMLCYAHGVLNLASKVFVFRLGLREFPRIWVGGFKVGLT